MNKNYYYVCDMHIIRVSYVMQDKIRIFHVSMRVRGTR